MYRLSSRKKDQMKGKIEFCADNGKYGIVDAADKQVIVPFEYDTVSLLDPISDEYILYRSGKAGAVSLNGDTSYNWIAPCEYDYYCHSHGDIFFYNDREVRCYFRNGSSKIFSDIHFPDPCKKYVFARDDEYYYILRAGTGEVLWRDTDNNYPIGTACLRDMGEVDGLPLFEDVINGGYIFPNKKGVLEYRKDLGSIVKPVIINDKNIANIFDEGVGYGVLDIRRGTFEKIVGYGEAYDDLTIDLTLELKFNITKGKHTKERVYKIPSGISFFGNDRWDW